jgi:hypothetical protein
MSKSTDADRQSYLSESRREPFDDEVAVYEESDVYHLLKDGAAVCGADKQGDLDRRRTMSPTSAPSRYVICENCLANVPEASQQPPESIEATGDPVRERLALLKCNPYGAQQLPEPAPGVPLATLKEDLDTSTLYSFMTAGILQKRYRVHQDPRYKGRGHLWGTAANCYRWVEENIESTLTPCGNATGVRCVESGETYTCTDESCDCRFDRETAAEVIE